MSVGLPLLTLLKNVMQQQFKRSPTLCGWEMLSKSSVCSSIEYQFLDDLSFVRPPKEVFDENSDSELATYMDAVRQRLSEAGWEGDGDLEIIWFPPFVDIGIED